MALACTFPTGPAYVAAALKRAGHQVFGFNANNLWPIDLPRRLNLAIDQTAPDIVCIGGLCTDYLFIRDALEIVKARRIPTLLGGPIVTYDRVWMIEHLLPDYAIVGYAEQSIVQLFDHTVKVENVSGLSYWKNCVALVHNPVSRDLPPLSQIAYPDYEPFSAWTMLENSIHLGFEYRYPHVKPRIMPLVASRGCPYACTFCVHHGDGKYRSRSINDIIKEIEYHYEKYQFNGLVIIDEMFSISEATLRGFTERLIQSYERHQYRLFWSFQTHPRANLNRETLLMLKESGCHMFGYGLESNSVRVLESMNKKVDVAQREKAMETAQECNMAVAGMLIFGDPAETKETAGETIEFYKRMQQGAFIWCGHVKPLPGSLLFKQMTIENKVDYYENIKNRIYNLTAGNSIKWRVWLWLVGYLSHRALGIKIAKTQFNLKTAVGTITIPVVCPYCEKLVVVSEYMGPVAIQHRPAVVVLVMIVVFLLGIFNKQFRLLRGLFGWPARINTACPNCNRRMRIK